MKEKTKKTTSMFPLTIRSASQLGNAIRRIRKMRNISQAELAQKSGLTQATISRLEKGVQKAEAGTLILILASLQVDLAIVAKQKSNFEEDLEALF